MKIRSGFVSNSSSSSFIIRDENKIKKAMDYIDNNQGYALDYYMLDGVLYTSFVNDCTDAYSPLCGLSDDEVSGNDTPYDEDDFVEFEGDRGVDSVWIEKSIVKNSNKVKMIYELLKLDNKKVNAIMKKYRSVWENEI